MGMFDYKDSRKKRQKMRKTERRKLILNPIIKTQKQEKKVKIHVHLPVRTYGTMYKAHIYSGRLCPVAGIRTRERRE
jgi:hypothetical protein